jgi:hypothetical protein
VRLGARHEEEEQQQEKEEERGREGEKSLLTIKK